MSRSVVIVGGVAGGMSAATRLRRLDEAASIVVVERSGYVSFANCGLPYYVGGVIQERSSLLLQTPRSLAARFGIDVRTRSEVVDIDPVGRRVTVRPEGGECYELPYNALVLAPGATPIRPPIPGAERALSLRDVEDVDLLAQAAASAGSAVVVGGGFIGVELSENLRRRGVDVTLVEATDHLMAPFDPEMVAPLERRLRDNGVDLRLSSAVTEIDDTGVTLSDGSVVRAGIVVMAIGVRPDSSLAQVAGVATNGRGAIVVDDRMATNVDGIYAVGDAVAKRDALDGSEVLVPLANTANLQGRLVADAIVGRVAANRPVRATAIVGVFGMAAASTGWNEKRLVASGRPYRAIHTHPMSHAGYYPGARQLSIKLLVDPETDAILGAQVVGEEGVDKRIDVLATAMAGGLTASELAELELAYAPQFGSAKDPVNMLGFIDRNIADGMVETVDWSRLAERQRDGAVVVDVRTSAEFAAGQIPGAINIPVDELRERLNDVPEGDVIVYCAVGLRGYLAARILAQAGRKVANLDGGYRTWSTSPASAE